MLMNDKVNPPVKPTQYVGTSKSSSPSSKVIDLSIEETSDTNIARVTRLRLEKNQGNLRSRCLQSNPSTRFSPELFLNDCRGIITLILILALKKGSVNTMHYVVQKVEEKCGC